VTIDVVQHLVAMSPAAFAQAFGVAALEHITCRIRSGLTTEVTSQHACADEPLVRAAAADAWTLASMANSHLLSVLQSSEQAEQADALAKSRAKLCRTCMDAQAEASVLEPSGVHADHTILCLLRLTHTCHSGFLLTGRAKCSRGEQCLLVRT
jgi:hypothetical protein